MHPRDEIAELIRNGENSYVEFKEDAIKSEDLAKEMVAFANADGGKILLGVSDSGSIMGLQRFEDPRRLEEWVMQAARDTIRPPLIPAYELIRGYEGHDIAVITVGPGPDVFARWVNNGPRYYMRVGSTSREASTEELQRLFQRRNKSRAELLPLASASYEDLDVRRIKQYFEKFRKQGFPETKAEILRRLRLVEFMTDDEAVGLHPNIAGTVLFGETPNRFITGAAIDAAAFNDDHANVSTLKEAVLLSAPAVRFEQNETRDIRVPGIVELAMEFVSRHTRSWTGIVGAVRVEKQGIPEEAIREAVVNALAHRDYTLSARTIQLRLYPDRIQIMSPGRLPNGITVEGMELGARASRNQLIVDTLRDYGYVERLGFGMPEMFRIMHDYNGSRPQLEEISETFIVTLRK